MYAKNKLPVGEGDRLIHAGPAGGSAGSTAPRAVDDILDLERRARRLRAETIAGLVARAAAWMRRRLVDPRNDAVEEYLSHASSLADVERRLREIERNGSFLPG